MSEFTIDYQDVLQLAVMAAWDVKAQRPNAALKPTSFSGKKDDHYIALVCRVCSDVTDENHVVDRGYIAFRLCEVRYRNRINYLPEFSSIEFLDPDYKSFNPAKKIHFLPRKVMQDDPNLYKQVIGEAFARNFADTKEHESFVRNRIGELCYKDKFIPTLLDFVDGKF